MKKEKVVYVAKRTIQKKNKDDKRIQYTSQASKKQVIPQVRVILPLSVRILIILLWTFIVIVAVMMWNAVNLFRTFGQWWKNNDGGKYKKVFSINLLAQYENFSLGYFLWGLFVPVPAKITSSGVAQFLINMISSYALLSDQDDKDTYFMMPYHMCENIAVGDFDSSGLPAYDDKSYAYQDVKWSFDDKHGWPDSPPVWRKLLNYWGVPSSENDDTSKTGETWEKDGNQNFFWHKYHLTWQTPFILAFMWNRSTDPANNATKWYEQAFLSAVGMNETTVQNVGYYGGWWGMVKYGFETEKDLSLGEITRILYSTQQYTPPDRSSCNATARGIGYGSAIAGGLASSLGLLAFAPSGIGTLFAVGASGLLTAGTSALQTAQKCDIK